MRNSLPVMVLLGASVLWGLAWLPLKALNEMGIEGLTLIFTSYGLLAILLTPTLLKQRGLTAANARPLLLIFVLGGGANIAFTYALIYGEVVRVMVLFYLLPVWGVLGGKFFLKEQVDGWRWLGVGLAISGAFILLGGMSIFDLSASWIDLIALLSGLLFALNNMVFRAAQNVPVMSKIGVMFYGVAVLSAALMLSGLESWPTEVSSIGWLALALYAVAWLLLSNLGSQWGVTHMESGRSSIIIIMELVAAVLSATLIGGETLTPQEMVGGVLILIAAFIEAIRDSEEGPVATETA